MRKYDTTSADDVLHITKMFDKAIEYCDYSNYDVNTAKNNDIIRTVTLLDEKENTIGYVMLSITDRMFVVTISTAYYVYSMKLLDINSDILAYFIRNATKAIDDFNESVAFFDKFFLSHKELCDEELFKMIFDNAIEEKLSLSYVDANVTIFNDGKVSLA